MMVYSASMIGNKYGTFTSGIPVSETYFLQRQAMWVVLAYIAFLVFSVAIPFEVFKNKSFLMNGYLVIAFLLFVPLFMPSINGARSWIRIGSFSFQPSTLAQLFIIMYMAYILETRKVKLRQLCTSSELFSIFSIILFVCWLIFSRDFEPTITWKHPNYFVYKLLIESKEVAHEEVKKYTYADGFKDKFIYVFSLGFGGFLFLYVMPLVSLPRVVAEHAKNAQFKPEFMILTVTVGGIIGTIFSLFVTRKLNFRRKPFLIAHGVLMIGFMGLGLFLVSTNVVLAYTMFSLSGFFMYSQYPVYLNLPYELPNMNSQRLTIMFGIFWAFGYAIYTLFNFTWSLVLNHMGYSTSILFYLLGSVIYIIFVFTFPETRPKK